jgi:mRNA interferase YafQ
MRNIESATAFRRDVKREAKGRYSKTLQVALSSVITKLAQDEVLDTRYRDHELIGNWQGYRECHIKPDLLLIYKKEGADLLRLARLGSHTELFD